MTPMDHMSHDVSYFSGPSTSGATKKGEGTEGVHVDEGEGYHKVK